MEGLISKSVFDRLPSAIKPLDEECQKIYIALRLRKTEHEMAKQLGLSLDEAGERIKTVRNELIKAGQLDLIEDPRFISIHAEDHNSQEMPIASGEMNIDEKLIIKEFLSCLKQSVSELPKHQAQILRLRYKYHLSAKDILGFSNKLGYSLIPEKELSMLKEQDIFYALNTALKEVFKHLRNSCNEAGSLSIESLKNIFEEIGI